MKIIIEDKYPLLFAYYKAFYDLNKEKVEQTPGLIITNMLNRVIDPGVIQYLIDNDLTVETHRRADTITVTFPKRDPNYIEEQEQERQRQRLKEAKSIEHALEICNKVEQAVKGRIQELEEQKQKEILKQHEQGHKQSKQKKRQTMNPAKNVVYHLLQVLCVFPLLVAVCNPNPGPYAIPITSYQSG